MRGLLYYEVPDLSVVPDYEALGPKLSAEGRTLALDFNTDVLSEVKALNLPGLMVFDVPISSTLDQIVANPSAFGLKNVTTPCFSGDFATAGSVCGDLISPCSGMDSIRPRPRTRCRPGVRRADGDAGRSG